MSLIFDSHAHYDNKVFDSDRDEILKNLRLSGVSKIINVGCDENTSKKSINLAKKYPFIYASVGIHPHDAKNVSLDYISKLELWSKKEKTVAIGEIGLDYHYNFSDQNTQKKVFEEQLQLAQDLSMPVIIHDREAHDDTLNLLKKYKPKGVVHCFSGSLDIAREVINLGMYVGLGGAVTFKNAKIPCLIAKEVPLEKLLLETDAPYMAPMPFRGKRCDSSMIKEISETIAKLRNMNAEDLLDSTNKNAVKLFLEDR